MPTYNERLDSMRKDERYKALDSNGKLKWELALQNRVREESGAEASQRLGAARAQPGFAGAASDFVQRGIGTAAGFADEGTLGHLARFASDASFGSISEPEMQGKLDALKAVTPGGARAGQIEGAFLGPASRLAGGIASGAAGAARGAITSAFPSLEQTFAKRLLTNLVTNAASGGGAVGTYEFGRNRDDSITLANRLSDSLDAARQAVTSPLGIGLIAGGSALQSIVPPKMTGAQGMAIDRYERATGKKVPTEIMTGSDGLQSAARYVAQFDPATVKAQRAEAVAGLSQYVDELASQAKATPGNTEAASAQAAAGVRKLIGTREAPGPIDVRRRAQMEGAFAASRERGPSVEVTKLLQQAAGIIKENRPRGTTSDLDPILTTLTDEFTNSVKGASGLRVYSGASIPMTVDSLDGIRKRIDGVLQMARNPPSGGVVPGSQTLEEAAQLRRAVVLARTAFPEVNSASAVSKDLHALMAPLRDVPMEALSDAQNAAYFAKVTPQVWATTQKEIPEATQQLRGWYLYRLTQNVLDSNGVLNPAKLKKTLANPGPLNRENVNAILPGFVDELNQYGELSTAMMKTGRFAGRASSTQAGSFLSHIFTDPMSVAIRLLGPVGAKAAISSALGGQIGEAARRVAINGPTPVGPAMIGTNSILSSLPNQTPGGSQ